MNSDIALCDNETCPLRMTCHRFISKPDPYWQSYGDFRWKSEEEGNVTCEHYWEVQN